MSKTPGGLDRGSLSTAGMTFFTVGASAPMTVVAGAVVAAYAVTGVKGLPLSFLLLMVALWPFTVGYTAMSRHVSHAGVFYAYLARGWGRIAGVAGGLLALLAYNAIQICLYGLLGASVTALLPGVGLPWWAWSLFAWGVVGVLGIRHITVNAKVLAVVLVAEVGMILLFDVGAFLHPAGGHLSLAGLAPGNLLVGGIGGVLAFGIASFVGYESGLAYAEEARGTTPVSRATFNALAFLGVLYCVSSLALSVAEGPSGVVDKARDPNSGIPFSTIAGIFGHPLATFANLLLITSILGALISFHNTVARYLYALGRERVLPARLGNATINRSGSPVAGSLVQSALALLVFGTFAIAGANPVTTLFTWLSAIAAIAIVLLMIATSVAVIGYFDRNPNAARMESTWRRRGAPMLGAVTLAVVLVVTVANINSLLGTTGWSTLSFVIPGLVVLTALGGAAWGAVLRSTNPFVYQAIGQGQLRPLEVKTPAFSDIEL